MPIGLDPNENAAYVLKRDREKPENSRPACLFHVLTRAESRLVRDLREKARHERDLDASERLLNDAILVGLVGWKNLMDRHGKAIEFAPTPDRLDDALTLVEKWELANNYPAMLHNLELQMLKETAAGK